MTGKAIVIRNAETGAETLSLDGCEFRRVNAIEPDTDSNGKPLEDKVLAHRGPEA